MGALQKSPSAYQRGARREAELARRRDHDDAEALAARAEGQGIILAPGSLFSPTQARSPWMRFHVACAANPRLPRFFASLQ
jgi:DNA-binding transcriptional MocR family regulator